MASNKVEEFVCAVCKETFEKGRSDDEANAEAKDTWGVTDASGNKDMAIICDDCFANRAEEDIEKMGEEYKFLKQYKTDFQHGISLERAIEIYSTLLTQEKRELLERFRMTEMPMYAAIKTKSDAGAGHTLGYNEVVRKLNQSIDEELEKLK